MLTGAMLVGCAFGKHRPSIEHSDVLADVGGEPEVVVEGGPLETPEPAGCAYRVTVIGRRFMPLMKLDRNLSIGPASCASPSLGSSSSNTTLSSIRAS